jgi:D-alanyl-lipoteichoic acid acyltransferase DltB (MBOAT superfamily)
MKLSYILPFSFLHNVEDNLMIRWWILFNIPLLRAMSFAFDYRWKISNYKQLNIERLERYGEYSLEARAENSPEYEKFDMLTFYAYVNYFPTNFGGPIITFNTWVS